jgi:glycosyltransferase involved in cell wall biosynthesis
MSAPNDLRRLAVVSEAIDLEPVEGIRRYGRELANALEGAGGFQVFRIGFLAETKRGKIGQIMSCRRRLREIDAEVMIYVPTSPRIFMNLLKFRLWKGRSKQRTLVLLQPPTGTAPFSGRVLRGVGLFRQFGVDLLQPSLRKRSWKLIPSGVNTLEFKPAKKGEKDDLRRRYGFAPGDRIVLSVGHLTEGRNLGLIMKIAKSMDAKTVFVTSRIEGDDLLIKAQLEESGVIVIDRYIEKIQEIYSIADCYIFPTKSSASAIGMPLSILEAMSCGVPVVSTRFGITQEILKEGRGIAFFDDDETAIRLVRETISKTGDNGAREAAIDFDWSRIARMIMPEA